VSGLLVQPADAPALATAIVKLLRDPVRARAMGRAGQTLVQEQYTIDAMMGRTTSVYSELLDS